MKLALEITCVVLMCYNIMLELYDVLTAMRLMKFVSYISDPFNWYISGPFNPGTFQAPSTLSSSLSSCQSCSVFCPRLVDR